MNNPTISSQTCKKATPILQIDAIKAFAIIMVTAFHFFGQLSGWHMKVVDSSWFFGYWSDSTVSNFFGKTLHFIVAYFYLGVNLFVITSGFGLYYSFLKSGKPFEFGTFFSKRVMKLIPSAIFAIVFLFFFRAFLLGWGLPISNPVWNLFPFLLGLNLFSDQWFFPPINGETWFLGMILQLYLLFPLLIILLQKLGKRFFLLVLLSFSVAFRILYYHFFQYQVSSLSYGLFAGRVFEFGFGMVIAQLLSNGKKVPLWPILGLVFFAGYFFPLSFPFSDSILGVALFTVLWALFSGLKKGAVLKYISNQSYMIFLIHHPFIWLLNKWGLVDMWTWKGILAYVIFFPLVVGVSHVSNLLVDRIMKVFQKKIPTVKFIH